MIRLFVLACIGASAALSTACSGPDCGPGDAPADGLTVDVDGTALTYGGATTSPNNDCSVDGAPTSLTIDIIQVAPTPSSRRALILCVPRPDTLDQQLALTSDAETTGVQVIDIFADADDCLIVIDRARAISGTASFSGACEDGAGPDGYALTLDGQVPATKMCNGMADEAITVSLAGELAVQAL